MEYLDKIKSNSLIKTGTFYSLASTLSSVFTMAVGFLNMRWLGPEILGVWSTVTIINSYLPFLQLGIQSGLNLELPIILGENNEKKAEEIVATALYYACLLSLLMTIVSIAVIAYLLLFTEADNLIVYGIAAVCVMAILSCYRLHFIATYRSANAFDKLSKIYLVDCVVSCICVFGIYYYKYYGLLFYQIIQYAVFTLLMWYYAPYRVTRPKFYMEHFKALLKRGIFMTIVNQIRGVVESLPRILILKFGTILQVGLFSPASVAGTFMNMVPSQVAQFIHPQMSYKYGQTKCAKDMWQYLKLLTIWAPILVLPIATIGWFLAPLVIEFFFPKYMDSIYPVRFMLIGFLFSTKGFARNFLTTIKAYKEVLFLDVVDLFFFILCPVLAIEMIDMPLLSALSIGLSFAYFITYYVNIIVTRITIFKDRYNATNNINS